MSDEQLATPKTRAAIEDAIAAADRGRAIAAALDAVDSGDITIEQLYEALSRLLVDIGDAWKRGTAEVWQEHLASGIVRSIVEACALRVENDAASERGRTVVLAAPTDEYHDLGLRMLADRFTLAGWRAQFLGANVPLGEIVSAIEALGADAVALSASTHFHRLRLKEYVDGLTDAHPNLRVWVGGPAFALEHEDWPDQMILDPLSIPEPGLE